MEIETQISNTISSKNDYNGNVRNEGDKNIEHKTVFREILNSNLPPEKFHILVFEMKR